MRLAISLLTILALLFIVIKRPKYFLCVIPVIPLANFMFANIEEITSTHVLTAGLVELALIGLFWMRKPVMDNVAICLIALPLLSLPSLINAKGHFLHSAYFVLLLSLAPVLYCYFRDNMNAILKGKYVEYALLASVLLGITQKIYNGVTGPNRDLSILVAIIFERGGSIAGSNYITQMIISLLALTNSLLVIILCNIFLAFTFSRGAIICLGIFWAWKLCFSFRKNMRVAAVPLMLLALIWAAPHFENSTIDEIYNFWSLRISSEDEGGLFGDLSVERYQTDPRLEIWKSAVEISKNTMLLGEGLGGYYWGQLAIGLSPEYSNAHNLYLTLLSEGGIFILIGYVALFGTMLLLAVKTGNNNGALAMVLLVVYCLFSGEFYESSRYITAGPYYYFLFILAYLKQRPRPMAASVPA